MNRINLLLSILCFIILINAVPVPPPVDTYYKEHPEAFEGSSLQDIEGAPNNSGGNSSNNLGDYNSIVEEGTYQNTNDNSNSNGQIEESQNYDNYASTTSVTKSPVTQTENTTNTTTPTNQNSDNNNETKNNKNGASKGLVTFVIVVFAIIIVLSVSILVYKKKYLGNENLPTRESTFGFKTGNLMEKIQTININNAETSNGDDVIIKYDIDNEINTSELKNALEPNKNNEQYNHWFDSMKRGLKPPPSHDNKNKKKKNGGSKITGSGSLLSISTKSKSPDLSKSYKSVSKDFSISRNSTDISARTQTMISQCSSNGGGAFGYKNNKLNKHSSVALTFGCLTEREDSYNELSSTSRISNIASSRVSKISTQNSSPRSLTSFISNSPITQSFKSRFSTYFSGGKKQVNGFDNRKNSDSDRTSYIDESSSSRNAYISKKSPYMSMSGSEIGNITSKKSLNKIDTSIINIRNDKDVVMTPLTEKATEDSNYTIENSKEQLISNREILTSFLNNNDKLDLSLSFK